MLPGARGQSIIDCRRFGKSPRQRLFVNGDIATGWQGCCLLAPSLVLHVWEHKFNDMDLYLCCKQGTYEEVRLRMQKMADE